MIHIRNTLILNQIKKINSEIFTLEKGETVFHYLLYQYYLGEVSSLHQLIGGTGHFKRLILVPCKASCELITRQQCGPQIKRGIYLAQSYMLYLSPAGNLLCWRW